MEHVTQELSMSSVDSTVTITLQIPEAVYQHATETAAHEQQGVEELLNRLILEGLNSYTTVRSILEVVSRHYRERLQQENRLNQSDDEILQDLRNIRAQVADELYSAAISLGI
jgi:hypothetical protein